MDRKHVQYKVNSLFCVNVLNLDTVIENLDFQNFEYKIFSTQRNIQPVRKIYISVYLGLNKYSTFMPSLHLLDSGSDICICRLDTLENLFSDDLRTLHSKIRPTNCTVRGFSGKTVEIYGFITLYLKFNKENACIPVYFYVLSSEDAFAPNGIIGISAVTYLQLTITSYNENGKNVPCVYRDTKTLREPVKSYFLNDFDICKLQTNVELKPHECSYVRVDLHEYMFHKKGDIYLLDSHISNEKICVIPSTCSVFVEKNKPYVYATVLNPSTSPFKGTVDFNFQILKDPDILRTSKEASYEVRSTPIISEVRILSSEENIDCPIIDNISLYEHTTEPYYEINLLSNPRFPKETIGYDPYCKNNGCKGDVSLTDERYPVKIENENSLEDFENDDTLDLSMGRKKDYDLPGFELQKQGIELMTAKDVVKLENYAPDIRENVKSIFVEKYPDIVSLNAFDFGDISKNLGFYTIKLRPGVTLPKYTKTYMLTPQDSRHMRDILEFLEAKDIIGKSPQTGADIFACASYLISRKDKSKPSRIIIDFVPLNKLVQREIAILPTSNSIINELRDMAFFSCTDLSGAYNSIKISEESQHLTTFSSPDSLWYCKTLITGGCNSPFVLQKYMLRVLNYVVQYDKNGDVIFEDEKKQLAKLVYKPLRFCRIYYDDLLIFSPWAGTYEKSRELHFKHLEEVAARLSMFYCKISIDKSEFFKSKLKFLGWEICSGTVRLEQKRIKAILDFDMPQTLKGWRVFSGFCNAARVTLSHDILNDVAIISDLTSPKTDPANPTKAQIKAFKNIKRKLISGPCFAFLVLDSAPKVVFCDSSTISIGSVCAQLVPPRNKHEYVPTYLQMSDKCHRIILSQNLNCVPIRYIKDEESVKDFCKVIGVSFPADTDFFDLPFFGLQDNPAKSLYLSIKSLFAAHANPKSHEQLLTIFKEISKIFRKEISGNRLKDLENYSKEDFRAYNDNLLKGEAKIDSLFLIFEVLAQVLLRPIIVIDSTNECEVNAVHRFREDYTKPAYFFLIYSYEQTLICRPAFIDKNLSYDLSQHAGTFEIIGYYSKKIPKEFSNYHICEKELYAAIESLENFKGLIGSGEINLITDSKALFYILSKPIMDSSEKMVRWGNRLFNMFPQMVISFCKTDQNLSDFLTRNYCMKPNQIKLTGLQRLNTTISDKIYDDTNMKSFTIDEWKTYVSSNEHLLNLPKDFSEKLDKQKNKNLKTKTVSSINHIQDFTPNVLRLSSANFDKSLTNLVNIQTSLFVLKDRFSDEILIEKQKVEYADLYQNVVESTNFQTTIDNIDYKISNDKLFIFKSDEYKILLPPSLILIVISFYHIASNHAGLRRISLSLSKYHCKGLSTKTKKFVRSCLTCHINNYDTRSEKLGIFPITSNPFEHVHLDFLENLQDCREYKYLMIVLDIFSLASYSFPLKSRKGEEFLQTFMYGVYQFFRPRTIYTDNTRQIINEKVLHALTSLGVSVIFSVPNSGLSHGNIEAFVKIYKQSIRKYLSLDRSKSWIFIPPLVSLNLNTTINPKHNLIPFEILFGKSRLSSSLDTTLSEDVIIHPVIQKSMEEVFQQQESWLEFLAKLELEMNADKIKVNKILNKTKNSKQFNPGQIVFIKRPNTSGFESVYETSIFKVLKVHKRSILIIRMSDSYVTLCHFNNAKLYDPDNEIFDTVSPEIKELCFKLTGNDKLRTEDYHKLLSADDFIVPDDILDEIGQNADKLLSDMFAMPNEPGPSH